MEKIFSLSGEELQRYQPNRYPFLMIDRVTEVSPGKYAYGYKNLSNNEWFFPKHFKGNPNMPGALQLESMAQMLTVAITTLPGMEGRITHAVEHTVKFMKEVLPGDKLEIKAELISWRRGLAKGNAICKVDNVVVSSAQMQITIPEIMKEYLPK